MTTEVINGDSAKIEGDNDNAYIRGMDGAFTLCIFDLNNLKDGIVQNWHDNLSDEAQAHYEGKLVAIGYMIERVEEMRKILGVVA